MASREIDKMKGGSGLAARAAQFSDRASEMFSTAEKPVRYYFFDRRENASYYFGRQDLRLSTDGKWFPLHSSESQFGEDSRYMVNPIVRTLADERTALVSGSVPTMNAIPTSSEPKDISLAATTSRAADAFWRYLKMNSIIQRAHRTAAIYGTVFLKNYWDEWAGSVKKGDDRPMGDVGIAIVHPNRVFAEPAAERVMPGRIAGNARWLFELQVWDVSELVDNPKYKRHEEKGSGKQRIIYLGLPDIRDIVKINRSVPTDDEAAMLHHLDRHPEQDVQSTSLLKAKVRRGNVNDDGGFVRIAFYWEQPNPASPRGRFAAFLPDNDWWPIEYREELPFADKDHPIGIFPWTQITDVVVPGTLQGKSRMTEGRDIQDQINFKMSEWFNLDRKFNPYGIIDLDSGIDEDAMRESSVAKWITWRSSTMGQKPEMSFPTGMSQERADSISTLTFLRRQLEDIMGIHTVRYHPKANPTATELQLARNEDLRNLEQIDVRRAEEECYAPTVNNTIRIAQVMYDKERMLDFLNDFNEPDVFNFKRSMLGYKDILIKPGSSMPKNATIQKLEAFEMMKGGFWTSPDPKEQQKLRRELRQIMGFTSKEELGIDMLNIARAKSEFQAVLNGQEIGVSPWEMHLVHNEQHYKDLNTPAFYNLPEAERGRVWTTMKQHIDHHNAAELSESQDVGPGISPAVKSEVAGKAEGMVVPAAQNLQLLGAQRNAEAAAAGKAAPQETNKTGGQTRSLP